MNRYIMDITLESIQRISVCLYNTGEKIAHGVVVICPRFEGKPLALIEDVWTKEECRRQGLASDVVKKMINIASERGCYKVVLNCSDENISFYERFGFSKNQNGMRLNID